MATNVSFQPEGFFVRGLLPGWDPDLDGLANYTGARRIIWADRSHTSLYVVCDNPRQTAKHLMGVLDGRKLTDHRQDATFVTLDRKITAVVFEHEAPATLHALLVDGNIGKVVYASQRTALLVHMKTDDEAVLSAEKLAWAALYRNDVVNGDPEEPGRTWPTQPIGHDMLIALDETTVAVLVKSTDTVNRRLVVNSGINLVEIGPKAIVLGAGERPVLGAREPATTERPSSFEYQVGLAQSLHALAEMDDVLRLDPPPATMVI